MSGVRRGDRRKFIETVAIPYEGDDCLIWPFSRRSDGYGRYKYRINGQFKHIAPHRLICIAVHGEPPTPDHQASHSCGNGKRGCVNPRHLRWSTPLENTREKKVHGTDNSGVRNGRAKLNIAQVRVIRLLKGKTTQQTIADAFSIARPTVGDILSGRIWRSDYPASRLAEKENHDEQR